MGKHSAETWLHANKKRHLAIGITAAIALVGFSAGFLYNGVTLAAWNNSSTTNTVIVNSGKLTIESLTPSLYGNVGRWSKDQHVSVANNVLISSVKMQPRTTLTYNATFNISLEGNNLKGVIDCKTTEPGIFLPISQTTGIVDSLAQAVPLVSLSIKNGSTAVTNSSPVANGDVITASVTLTHPDKIGFYQSSGLPLELPTAVCSIAQVR